MRELLVDDLPDSIRLLLMKLRPKGYETESAGNGHEALKKAHLGLYWLLLNRPPDPVRGA